MNTPSASTSCKPLGIFGSLVWFGVPAIALFAGTRVVIPLLTGLGLHQLYGWYITATLVMGGMFIAAVTGAPKPTGKSLRLEKLDSKQRKLTVIVVFLSLLCMALFWKLSDLILGKADSQMPPFLEGTVLNGQNRLLLFLAWLPMFFFNIMGEELLWRGYLLPRQELSFGRYAWLANGFCWIIFHIPFGARIIFMVLPVFFALPWMAQRTGNTWPGVILHALVNGPAFAMILLGVI